MSITVGEVLQNAEYNISNASIPFQMEIGKEQLRNYRIAKEIGANDDDDWADWEDKIDEYKQK